MLRIRNISNQSLFISGNTIEPGECKDLDIKYNLVEPFKKLGLAVVNTIDTPENNAPVVVARKRRRRSSTEATTESESNKEGE